jgi:glucosamine-6-phosphate deaminase
MGFDYSLADFIDFRDRQALARVRGIRRSDITKHPNPEFRIEVIDSPMDFYSAFASDIVSRVKAALDEERRFVGIFPVGPMPQYQIAARLINDLRLPMSHVHIFFMDEYADEDGNTAPVTWPGSFQAAAREHFFALIDAELRPPDDQIHFPVKEVIGHYSRMIADLGGADVCYGGIGWGGHIAFWEPQLGHEFGDDLHAYKCAEARLVELHPMTIMQNALHSFSGDWSFVPPKANTIGPADIMGAKHRSFWLDGYLGGGVSWQRFIGRLVAYGPVNTLVPGSILQEAVTDYTLLGGVADDVVVKMA